MEQRTSRRRPVGTPPGGKWLTTFNDLVTLLLVFFVLVFAMSKGDMEKIREIRCAVIRGFSVLNERSTGSRGLLESTKPQLTTGKKTQKKPVSDAVREIIAEIEAMPEVVMENNEDEMVIRISGKLFFGSGSSTINPSGYPLLRKIGALISRLPNRLRVEGHTDNVPISTEAFPSNWELSAARAVNILKFLLNQMDVHPRRLSAVGYGESRPLKANYTLENRAFNRRVDIVLQKDGEF